MAVRGHYGSAVERRSELAATAEGISFKTFKRAKEELGVISYQRGRQWYWELPIDVEYSVCPSEGQEGQKTLLVPLRDYSA